MSENAIAVQEQQPRFSITRELLEADAEQRGLLGEYIARSMREGVDYGKIPGTEKPTLLKPGAEKLVDLFRCTPSFALVRAEEDFETGFFNYMFRVRLKQRDSKAVLAEGFGSCNSREGRYRWRNANRKCPTCGKESIIKGDEKYGGGWVCWKKKDGCGAKFPAGTATVESQAGGRVENDDIATMANTILKMAKKRALVDGAIALARCSDMFTQDVEDFAEVEARPAAPQPPPGAATAALREKLAVAPETQPEAAPAPAPRPRPCRIIDNTEGPPPPTDADNPWASGIPTPPRPAPPAQSDFEEEPPMSFGSGKGKPLSELTPKDLTWYAKVLAENVADPDKARFLDNNRAALASIKREQARR